MSLLLCLFKPFPPTPEMFPSLIHHVFGRKPQPSPAAARSSSNPIRPCLVPAESQAPDSNKRDSASPEEVSLAQDSFASPMQNDSDRQHQSSSAVVTHNQTQTQSKTLSARRVMAAVRRVLPTGRSPPSLRFRLKGRQPKSNREGVCSKTSDDGQSQSGGGGDFGQYVVACAVMV